MNNRSKFITKNDLYKYLINMLKYFFKFDRFINVIYKFIKFKILYKIFLFIIKKNQSINFF